ncbi:MAG: hypothetical protein AB7G93_14100 [Bdellovibrionales bacterium]
MMPVLFAVVLSLTGGLGTLTPNAFAGPSDLPSKSEELKGLVEKLVHDGYDPTPIAKLASSASEAMDKKKDPKEAERLLDQAIALAKSKKGLRRPRPPGSPVEIQARLEGKMKKVQSHMESQSKKGKDISAERKKLESFQQLMQQGEVKQAEDLLDEVLASAK